MKKKRDYALPRSWNTWREMLFLKIFFVILFFCACLLVPLGTYAQQKTKVTLDLKDVTLNEVIIELKKQTSYDFFYNSEKIKSKGKISTVKAKGKEVKQLLEELLPMLGLEFSIEQNLITIREIGVDRITVSGRVFDERGDPLPGATVIIYGTTLGAVTDKNGRYTLNVKPDDVLRITFIGYKTQTIPVEGKTTLNVKLELTEQSLEEVTVVAFGEQKKESVVSAITTVRAEELKSSSSDLTTTFAGRIPGMIAWQTGGLPGALTEEEMNTKFYIRGITSFQTGANIDPLILLDGVESSKLDLARLNPEDIESFSVMEDAAATAMYGARGANGVILVTTKKGKEGAVYTTVRYEAISSMPTKEIEVVDPVTWMKSYNEALMGRNPLATPVYTAERITNTGSKKYPSWVYPSNDWYDILFKKRSVNHHLGLTIRGGSKLVQYYASINHSRDEGMLKTDRLNQFKVNIKNNTTTLRVNLNIDLTAGIKLVVNTYSSIDKYHGPINDVSQAYYLAFIANPVDFAAVYPKDDYYNFPHIPFGGSGVSANPYAMIQRGYRERSRFSTLNKVEYIHNLSSLLRGLELRANAAWQQEGYYQSYYSTNPYFYALRSYNYSTGEQSLYALNPTLASRMLYYGGRELFGSTRLSGDVRLLHIAAWREHTTSYTAVFAVQEATNSTPTNVQQGIPNRNLGLSMRFAYGFRDRYFLEGSFGYNGSERFAKKNRFGFFPAFGAAWVVSKEEFMQSISGWVSFLKLRASYGKVGNDGIIKTPRFVYLQEINEYNWQSPRPNTTLFTYYHIRSYENKNIKWEIAEQTNLGLEAKFFNGVVEFTLDGYQEIRHNVIANRTVIPQAIGLGYQPLDNIGKVKSRGIDFSGKIQHAFNPDLWVILNTTLTYNRATFEKIEEAADIPKWQVRMGHDISQRVGYIAESLFRDQAEVDNAPIQGGDVMPGDIRYRDVDGNGVIDVRDAVHIGFPETPRLIYGFNGFVNYKGFEFAFAFQGSGQRGFFINPYQVSPFAPVKDQVGTIIGRKALLKDIHEDHWSPDNMKERPLWPRLSTNNIVEHNPQENWTVEQGVTHRSTYFMREVKFLRCQSLELGYNLSKRLSERMRLKNLKVFVRTNNPFIISNFKMWDVELGENGFNYPIQKSYSLGLNLSF